MILITHPRCGSHWFVSGLTDHKFDGHEIFGESQSLPSDGSYYNIYADYSFADKIEILKNLPSDRVHKIHISDLLRNKQGSAVGKETPILLEHLRSRDDVYLMKRRNTRAALISLFVAGAQLGYLPVQKAFHNSPHLLTRRFTLQFSKLLDWYRMFYSDFVWLEKCLKFKEIFYYEDLISGWQEPQTFNWINRSRNYSKVNSLEKLHLIENLQQVELWMDLLDIPGNLYEDIIIEFDF